MSSSYHLAEIVNQRVYAQNEKVLGLEHPDTLTSMANLAWTFWSLDLKKEAIQLMRSGSVPSEKMGSDHPHTIESIHALQEWRDGKKAKRLLRWFRHDTSRKEKKQ